ncbi:MAG: S8 family serine peptidase [Terriglobales bacterium]
MSARLKAALLCLIMLSACLSSAAQTKNYVILAAGQGRGSTAFAESVAAAGGLTVANLEHIGVVTATSDDPQFAARMAAMPGVKAVAEDPEIQWINNETAVAVNEADLSPSGLNSEPFWGYQWNMRYIRADKTAELGLQGFGARVAVLDSGMITQHPDIAANVNQTLKKSYVPGEGVDPLNPGFNHGTHVGGIIAAAINDRGTQGVAPRAELVPIKVLRENGKGSFGWLIQGLAYAESIQADVANMSLGAVFFRNPNVGCEVSTVECNAGYLMAALNRAINHATAAGVLSVSSAGNEGVDLNSQIVSIPAQSGHGMAVSALGPYNQANFDRLASYSNYGQSVINVAAPGGDGASENVMDYVLAPGGFALNADGSISYRYYFAVGTSMAAPHVSGLAAVLVGQYGHIGPTRLQSLIQQSAVDILKPGADPQTGKGRIDALAATQQ